MKFPLGEALERVEQAAWEDIARAAPPAFGEAMGVKTVRIAGGIVFLTRHIPHNHFNWIMPGLADGGCEAIREGLALLRAARAADFLITIPPGDHEETSRDLARREGLAEQSPWSKFVRPTADPPPQDGALDLREAEDGMLFAATVVRGYGLPEASIPWIAALVGRPRWKTYLVWDGGKPVAGATLFVDGAVAWFGIDATLPGARGRGCQTALLARRIADAGALGAETISGEAEVPVAGRHATSHANILRAGFTIAYRRTNWAPR